jgi:diguanylate cyclase (GGDEF)-like protein
VSVVAVADADDFRAKDDTGTRDPPQAPRPEIRERHPALVVLTGPAEGQIFILRPDLPLILGRDESCEVRLIDDGISRRHASVRLTPNGDVSLADLGSRNGTYVGFERTERCTLRGDEIIHLGATTTIRFCLLDAIEEQYRRRMAAAALRDPLTGAYNRRHFEECLASECAAARRHRRALSLLLLDLDSFKRVNDRHGHRSGDNVLKGVVEVIGTALRKEDTLFRYGGEELAILVRETGLVGAARLAERLRAKISSASFAVFGEQDAGIRITISVGVAEFAAHMTEDALVDRADAALYQAKREGKNRVVSVEG